MHKSVSRDNFCGDRFSIYTSLMPCVIYKSNPIHAIADCNNGLGNRTL